MGLSAQPICSLFDVRQGISTRMLASYLARMWRLPYDPALNTQQKRAAVSRDFASLSRTLVRDTQSILRTTKEAISRSHECIRVSDLLLSQYVPLPEDWKR